MYLEGQIKKKKKREKNNKAAPGQQHIKIQYITSACTVLLREQTCFTFVKSSTCECESQNH